MNIRSRIGKANSLHVQVIIALLLACLIPLVIVFILFMNNNRELEKQELQTKVQELCADFSNRIQNTGYLTNPAQTELSAAMDTVAQIFNGR